MGFENSDHTPVIIYLFLNLRSLFSFVFSLTGMVVGVIFILALIFFAIKMVKNLRA